MLSNSGIFRLGSKGKRDCVAFELPTAGNRALGLVLKAVSSKGSMPAF